MSRSRAKIIFFKKNNAQDNHFNKKLNINFNFRIRSNIVIHTGNTSHQIMLDKNMVGFKLGEFVLNKKIIKHAKSLQPSSKKVQKQKNNKIMSAFKNKYNFLK